MSAAIAKVICSGNVVSQFIVQAGEGFVSEMPAEN